MNNTPNKRHTSLTPLVIAFVLLSYLLMLSSMSIPSQEEPVVEEQEVTEVYEEVNYEVTKELFVTVYQQNSTYKVVCFTPTGLLYAISNRGDFVPMTDELGHPLTITDYKRLTSEEK